MCGRIWRVLRVELSLFVLYLVPMVTNVGADKYAALSIYLCVVIGASLANSLLLHLSSKVRNIRNQLPMPIRSLGVSVLVLLVMILIILATFGSDKAYGEYVKLNGILEQGRVIIGGDESFAREYFMEQKDQHLKHARNFTLRRSWGLIGYPNAASVSWEDLISFRVQRMADLLEQEDVHDFLIEKDKCFMYNFFKSQAIPFVPIYGDFSDEVAATGALTSILRSSGNTKESMIFIKACHLTQGSDNGTLIVKMEADLLGRKNSRGFQEKLSAAKAWIKQKLRQKPSDPWRPWSKSMKKLLETVKAGIMIQKGFGGPSETAMAAMGLLPKPIEAKVEVLWGRAYLAFLHDYKVFAFRDCRFEKYESDFYGNIWHSSVPDAKEFKWLCKDEEDYLTPVFELAELVARKIGIEQLRVDIFIEPGRPTQPVVNEISLASGVLYRYHAPFMAQIWVGGHEKRGSKSFPSAKNSNLQFLIPLCAVFCSLIGVARAVAASILMTPLAYLRQRFASLSSSVLCRSVLSSSNWVMALASHIQERFFRKSQRKAR
mmetsp:Transcript_10713/g.17397  ORF Transcript_10713/g.17397 Transcript_10713/m.17397 type:complete len:546 (+) Transcript_10713:72-1709(+)